MNLICILAAPLLYVLLAAAVLATIDKRDELKEWYESAPNGTCRLFFWTFWPLIAAIYCWSTRTLMCAASYGADGVTKQEDWR